MAVYPTIAPEEIANPLILNTKHASQRSKSSSLTNSEIDDKESSIANPINKEGLAAVLDAATVTPILTKRRSASDHKDRRDFYFIRQEMITFLTMYSCSLCNVTLCNVTKVPTASNISYFVHALPDHRRRLVRLLELISFDPRAVQVMPLDKSLLKDQEIEAKQTDNMFTGTSADQQRKNASESSTQQESSYQDY